MKNRSLLIATALILLPAASIFAAEDADVSGFVELGIRAVDEQDHSAKYLEYRDIDDGLFGNMFLQYFQGAYYFDVEGKNIGLDDQSYLLEGGHYGTFDYSFFYDEIPHNLSFDALTFHSGLGSNTLTLGGNPDDVDTWRTFDYSVDRKKYGADVGFSLNSPVFFNVGVSREEKDGLKPLGSGEFSGQVEMPEPVDYETDNLTVAGGFRSTEIMFKVTGMLSSFDNENKYLMWYNPFTDENEINSLPPDNDYGKIGAHLTWRKLPMMSALLIRGSYSNLSNDFNINELNLSGPSGLNTMTFDGDISYTTFTATLVSRPTDRLDTRLFYSFLDKENDSTVILYNGGGNDSHLFGYTKNNAGLDGTFALGMDTRLTAGYEFMDIDRDNRHDVDSNTDHMLFAKLKNTSLDLLTAKVEYTFLDRDADSEIDPTLTPSDAAYISRFISRFDYTSKKENELKFILELYPMDNLDVGLEYAYVNNDYDDVVLGRTEDTGHEFYLDLMWRLSEMFNLNGFAGYESYEADSNHYNHRAGFQGQTADPTVEDGNPASFVWGQTLDDDFWTVGLMGKLAVIPDKLWLSLSGQYQESDGETEFTTQGPTPLANIDKAEDYDIVTIEAKAQYTVSEALALALGYVYEETEYEDLQYIGYEYQPSGSLLTGAYADHDYETHLGYVTVKYTF